ncbi:MAG: 5-methylcytosine-specific restriction endonuclease system specificity protein McrC [Dermatophilus congolensis]|nr:5-methylcytosine-specific restriction endonuclease system specificity protein McrC [Dermatophilus congolensis]
MRDRSIVIRNVYVMMAYAFRALNAQGTMLADTERFDHIHDLFAEILAHGVAAQVKRGLHHDYLRREERLTGVRGRIDLTRTALGRATAPGTLTCSFDEFEPDTPHNRALKSVVVLLIRHGQVARARKDALRRLLPYLDAVTLIAPRHIEWRRITYHRANAGYRLLLSVCEMVVRGLLQTEDSGDTALANWLNDDAMSNLFERFVREYYALHHPELHPAARTVEWDYDPERSFGVDQLPAMRTDVTLRGEHQTLIIDAKYYGRSMQSSRFSKQTIHSANLYQILTYAKNADRHADGSVSGLLLYAQTDGEVLPKLDALIQGTRISARSLRLDLPWANTRCDLEAIIKQITRM